MLILYLCYNRYIYSDSLNDSKKSTYRRSKYIVLQRIQFSIRTYFSEKCSEAYFVGEKLRLMKALEKILIFSVETINEISKARCRIRFSIEWYTLSQDSMYILKPQKFKIFWKIDSCSGTLSFPRICFDIFLIKKGHHRVENNFFYRMIYLTKIFLYKFML